MPAQFWEALVNPIQAANNPAAIAYTGTAITDISPGANTNGAVVFPANFLTIGSTIRLTAHGVYTSSASATNLTIGFYYGAVAGVALAASAATAITTSQTNAPWRIEYVGTVRSIGTSGTIMGQGFLLLGTAPGTYAAALPMPAVANAVVTIDTTTAKAITVGATSSVAQSYTVNGFTVESMA